jgi:hypothetical protein
VQLHQARACHTLSHTRGPSERCVLGSRIEPISRGFPAVFAVSFNTNITFVSNSSDKMIREMINIQRSVYLKVYEYSDMQNMQGARIFLVSYERAVVYPGLPNRKRREAKVREK